MNNNEQLKLENQLCFRLYTAARLIVQAYEPFLKPHGITYTQYLVLLVLWDTDNQPINDIGKRLLLGINTTSPLIKRMEKQGLVARHGSDTDKRQQIVYLTQKGKDMKKIAAEIPECMTENIRSCNIEPGKLMTIIPILDDFIDKMNRREHHLPTSTEQE
ncbi:MAG: MarR family transcriptional regulator [Prevotella sp.]|uniref:MarR family winged helix-turn-helix transcriptional regulator n=1 Tax=Prevotella sp. TaxID=59823 RepID=UPI002A2BD3F7|nr:MarR family transcriptional regulator [Prevotella sp.]MDD7318201.1 MarR family transcriptional regulator [Prevotellaceae bacterium]MDY4020910.1 MarR family transcriptional regulator [Prevotella sp.]